MAASYNRRYLRCEPIEGIHAYFWLERIRAGMLPAGYEPVALLYRESYYIPDGLLVRTPAGYMHYHGGFVRSLDQRKVLAALDSMALREKRKAAGEPVESVVNEAERLLAEEGASSDDE